MLRAVSALRSLSTVVGVREVARPISHLHTAVNLRSSSSPQEESEAEAKAEAERLQSTVDRSKLRQLSFNDYLSLKQKQKRLAMVMALPSYIGGATLASYLCVENMPNLFPATPEEAELVMGQEPIVVAAAVSTISGVVGALAGSSLFGVIWRLFNGNKAAVMDARELDFRLRIIRHRAGGDEFSHDFYGDKVKNVKDYRRWLKEQRKIRRKKETGVTVDAEPASKPAA